MHFPSAYFYNLILFSVYVILEQRAFLRLSLQNSLDINHCTSIGWETEIKLNHVSVNQESYKQSYR